MGTVDLTQFHRTFFAESLEGLDAMEAALLALDGGASGSDLVDTIFRAAHSIKGGAATFGFADVAAFTHVAESLLAEVREGHRQAGGELVELMLRSVDCLRGMIERSRAHAPVADADSEALRAQLQHLAGTADAPSAQALPAPVAVRGWHIRFVALPQLLQSGNDPLRVFRELQALGRLEVSRAFLLDTAPAQLTQLDPTQCFLGWELLLHGDVARDALHGVFEWLDGDCELAITALPERRDASASTATAAPPASIAGAPAGGSIRVDIDKIDALINMMGELVITQSMLSELGEHFDMTQLPRLRDRLTHLERNTRQLQESVMGIRMLPIASVFNRFPRLVHDLERKLDKRVSLRLHGEHTELDKTVLEKIGDPLVHLVRNAIDHGLEKPAQRLAAGKSETGTLSLDARHEGGNIVVQVSDDGAGLNHQAIAARALQRGLIKPGQDLSDAEIAELIFQPGFTTSDTATDLSGRGVGMDVVRRNVRDLGGSVGVRSVTGKGSAFTITLPLTLAIIEGLVTAVGQERYILPLISVVESLRLRADAVRSIAGGGEVFAFRDGYVPILRLHQAFACEGAVTDIEHGIVVVVDDGGRRVGLLVDALVGQQQAVIKSLEANYRRVRGISGATILSDGFVALIIDVAGVVRMGNAAKQAA